MGEEAGFLSAIRQTPADDATRLVYADWLDERDRAPEAEYLRLVVELAYAETDYTRDRPEVRRLLTISESLPTEWRSAAASRFKVVYYGHSDPNRDFDIERKIHEITGIGGIDGRIKAHHACEQLPSELLKDVSFEQALAARDRLQKHSEVTVLVHPNDRIDLLLIVMYDIVATQWFHDAPDDSEFFREGLFSFAKFLQAILHITTDEASALAQNPHFTLARNVELSVAKTMVSKYSDLRYNHPQGGAEVTMKRSSIQKVVPSNTNICREVESLENS